MMKSGLLLSSLVLFTNAAAAAEPALIPIEHFVEEPTYSQPRLSPDGKHVAINVRMERNGRRIPTMTVYTLPELKHVSTIALPAFEIPVNFFWLSNTRLVVKKGLELGARVQPVATGEVVAVNIDGTRQEYLFGYKGFKQSIRSDRYGNDYGYGQIVHIPESLNGHLLLGSYFWDKEHSFLYDIDSFSVIRKQLADIPAEGLEFMVQNDGKPRFAYGMNEKSMPVLYRRDDASGEWRSINFEAQSSRYHPFAFTPDNKAVYVSHSLDGAPYSILREDMATGERTPVASDPLGNIDHFEFTTRPSVPFAYSSGVGIPKARYLDDKAPDAQLHKTLSAAFPSAYVKFIDFSDDGQRLLFSVKSDRDPGSFYLFDKKTGQAEVLFENMDKIDPHQMAERRPFVFTARDGMKITGFITLPAASAKGKVPMVLLPHGGPIGIRDDWFFDTDAQFLASRGYAVLQVNFRGSGGRGKGFEAAGYKEFGGKMMDDLIDGVKWAGTLPEVDGNRVCVYGISFGGYAALMLPVRAPSMFKCSVGYSGLYYLPAVYTQDSMSGDKQGKNYFIRTMGDDPALLKEQSPAMRAAEIKVPVLMAHGGNDKVTEPNQALMMHDALVKVGRRPEWVFEKDEGHGFYDVKRQKNFYERLEAFLGKHLAQPATAP
jgi:dipeptidyl aminopeptidase/acylaminoacyl peptidase